MKFDISEIASTIFKPKIIWSCIFIIVFATSFIASSFTNDYKPIVLCFPNAKSIDFTYNIELRYIKKAKTTEAFAKQLVEELLLGPASSNLTTISEPTSDVNLVKQIGKKIYIDLDNNVLFGKKGSDGVYQNALVDFRTIESYIKNTIKKNIRDTEVFVTVGGLEAFWNYPQNIENTVTNTEIKDSGVENPNLKENN